MNYLSVCSGIEAASCAWHDFGWNPIGFSEIEKFPSEVLAHHYPNTPNLGDMTKYKEWDFGSNRLDLLVGGTPCQSFSVAGLRKGLDDPRGNLALTYVGILDKFRPKWCVWENVPGVLSSGGGRDFGAFLGALGELGYGWAYRVLNAQYFGVPQRRRRVFVVGCLGNWESAAKILFEPESLRWDIAPSQETRKEIATDAIPSFEYGGSNKECADTVTSKWAKGSGGPSGNECGLFVAHKVYENHPADSRADGFNMICTDITGLLTAKDLFYDMKQHHNPQPSNTFQLTTNNCAYVRGDTPLVQTVAYSVREDAKANTFSATELDVANSIGALQPSPQSHHAQVFDTNTMAVRRLTEIECERLQGFPDNYTNIKENCPSGARYKSLGNSMAVPVMRWIGNRIKNLS